MTTKAMQAPLKPNVDATALRIGMVVSRYHADVTGSMQKAAIDAFVNAGGNPNNLQILPAPGTFELTAICRAMAHARTRTGAPAVDAIVALGCIITGETTHDQYIAQSVTQGLTSITVHTGIPIAFGVLTCQSIEQARTRSIHVTGDRTNKGTEAMLAAIECSNTIKVAETVRGLG